MPSYKATATGFFDGTMYGPDHPRRTVVTTDKPLNPVPSWLEPIEEETQAQRRRRTKSVEVAKAKKADDEKAIESASYTEDMLQSKGVETL